MCECVWVCVWCGVCGVCVFVCVVCGGVCVGVVVGVCGVCVCVCGVVWCEREWEWKWEWERERGVSLGYKIVQKDQVAIHYNTKKALYLFDLLYIRESWKKYYGFQKIIKQHKQHMFSTLNNNNIIMFLEHQISIL